MKKILGISLCALFAVSAANAEIASTEWVNQQVGGMDAAATTGEYVKVVSQADGKVSATGASFEDTLNAATQDNAPTSKAVADHVKGAISALNVTATTEDYVKVVSQANGKVVATGANFDDEVTATSENAPTSKAVADYVADQVSDLDVGALTNRVSANEGNIATNTSDIATNATNIQTNTGNITTLTGRVDGHDTSIAGLTQQVGINEGKINTLDEDIQAMDLTETTGQYVTVVSQTDGKVSATGANFATNVATGGTNAPTSDAVVTYVRDNAVQTVAPGTANGTIKVDGTDVAVTGLGSAAYTDASTLATTASLKALAYKDTVTSTEITNGTITNDDISGTAKIAMSKIDFTGEQTGAIDSGIDSAKVTQIATNTDSIGDIQDFLDTMINEAPGYADCKNSTYGCTLVVKGGAFLWEKVTRAAE